MIHSTPQTSPAEQPSSSRRSGFTLAEAVIASGFVGIALAGILSLAPALIRGQHEIAERTRAHAAATELLGMFERKELPEMTPDDSDAEPEEATTSDLIKGIIGELIVALTPDADAETPEPELITQINTTIRGFDAQIDFITVDPVTLDPDPASTTTALITIVIRSDGRELARLQSVHTDAWTQADHRRTLAP